jgi:rhodanese-related sulfurtransferase
VSESIAQPARFGSIDELLADARSRLTRLSPRQAAAAVDEGARLVDIRPGWQRGAEGEIPGAVVVERNHIEWRLHPDSESRLPDVSAGQRWIVVCSEGYTSSLAADSLRSLGIPATDVIGGIQAWIDAGLPTVASQTGPDQVVAAVAADDADGAIAADAADAAVAADASAASGARASAGDTPSR